MMEMSEKKKDLISEVQIRQQIELSVLSCESLFIQIKTYSIVCHLLIGLHYIDCNTDKFTINIYPQAFDSINLLHS